MKEKVKIIDRGHSWTVIDLELGYRICNSHQDHKDADHPSHIHDRFDEVVTSCNATSPQQAYNAMKADRRARTGLDIDAFEKEIKKWK